MTHFLEHSLSNTQSFNYTIQFCPVYLKVTVTSSNGFVATATRLFNCAPVYICNGFGPAPSDRESTTTQVRKDFFNCMPNPTKDQLTVLFDQPEEEIILTVTDISGNIKKYHHPPNDKEVLTLDVSSWQPGIWLIRADSSTKSETKKICIIK